MSQSRGHNLTDLALSFQHTVIMDGAGFCAKWHHSTSRYSEYHDDCNFWGVFPVGILNSCKRFLKSIKSWQKADWVRDLWVRSTCIISGTALVNHCWPETWVARGQGHTAGWKWRLFISLRHAFINCWKWQWKQRGVATFYPMKGELVRTMSWLSVTLVTHGSNHGDIRLPAGRWQDLGPDRSRFTQLTLVYGIL